MALMNKIISIPLESNWLNTDEFYTIISSDGLNKRLEAVTSKVAYLTNKDTCLELIFRNPCPYELREFFSQIFNQVTVFDTLAKTDQENIEKDILHFFKDFLHLSQFDHVQQYLNNNAQWRPNLHLKLTALNLLTLNTLTSGKEVSRNWLTMMEAYFSRLIQTQQPNAPCNANHITSLMATLYPLMPDSIRELNNNTISYYLHHSQYDKKDLDLFIQYFLKNFHSLRPHFFNVKLTSQEMDRWDYATRLAKDPEIIFSSDADPFFFRNNSDELIALINKLFQK